MNRRRNWLLRKYGFAAEEIPFEPDGSLSLVFDLNEMWARSHPERFPVDVNHADKEGLLRVPGFGLVTVGRVLKRRREGRMHSIADVGKPGKRLTKAARYVTFGRAVSLSTLPARFRIRRAAAHGT